MDAPTETQFVNPMMKYIRQLYEENKVDHTFYYVYINKQGLNKEGIDEKRKIILSNLVEPLTEIYKKESL